MLLMINFHRVKVELQEIIENFLELFGTFTFEKTSGYLLLNRESQETVIVKSLTFDARYFEKETRTLLSN